MKLAIVGGGWAGWAAAVRAVEAGHAVTVFEAARTLGGRARGLPLELPDGNSTTVDNGQHILIGAYTCSLALMRQVGVDLDAALLRQPLELVHADGAGVRLPDWPAPWDALAGIACARGWSLADRASLLGHAARWRLAGFRCDDALSVAQLCTGLRARPMAELVEPLCVSALNTPSHEASARVFLRVMHDAVFGPPGASNLLLPRWDLGALFPQAAQRWTQQRGAELRLGRRVQSLQHEAGNWRVDGEAFDHALLATAAPDAQRLLASALPQAADALRAAIAHWQTIAGALAHRPITTVYAWAPGTRLPRAMTALHSAPPQAPAQFVFDRSHLGGPAGLLAFVVSDSAGTREELEDRVLEQARRELGIARTQALRTVVEKRATFACTPGLRRPAGRIAPGLSVAGDYIEGPYPATLEGAVRAAEAALPVEA